MAGKSLAVITARGGSKRIPHKNIKLFCGKPIIQYSIEAALKSGVFDMVMVSTDDEEIKEIALGIGAEVPFLRTKKTADDNSMTHEVLIEVINEYQKMGIEYEYVCCIYPTAPFITPDILKESKIKIQETGADCVVPIVAYSFPPQRGFVVDNKKVRFKWPENRLIRSQDLEKMYHDCGQFYFLKTIKFVETGNLIMENTIPILMNEMDVQDIDNNEDWEMAELKYKLRSR